MSKIRIPNPVNLFIGVIFNSKFDLSILKEKFFDYQIDFESSIFEFKNTNYYSDEMGNKLFKKFYSFSSLLYEPLELSNIKHKTYFIEKEFTFNGNRIVNIDPGYLNLPKVVLCSFKDFAHRIYIGNNTYAEVTLSFIKNKYIPMPWTYPDYKSMEYINFFMDLREKYRLKLV